VKRERMEKGWGEKTQFTGPTGQTQIASDGHFTNQLRGDQVRNHRRKRKPGIRRRVEGDWDINLGNPQAAGGKIEPRRPDKSNGRDKN